MNNLTYIKEKTLLLVQTDPNDDMVFKQWLKSGLNADIIFRDIPKPVRLVRRYWMNLPLGHYGLWLADWKYKIENYETVIIHASEYTRHIPKFIHNIKPSMRIIYWYWNPVNYLSLPSQVSDENVEYWSFDEGDCQKYKLKRNIQYYYDEPIYIEGCHERYDIYFVGHDKGRKNKIQSFVKTAESLNLKCQIDLVSKYSAKIPYETVRKRISRSRAILEFNQPGQIGYTLRAMEALFLEKKLITENKEIMNEPFYNKDNIFILNVDEINTLEDFIRRPFNNISCKYKNHYDIEAWLMNFFRK